MDVSEFEDLFSKMTSFQKNDFHPLVWILGKPSIGKNVYIGGMSEIQAKDANVTIGDNCDIASFVAINAVDSHKKCIGLCNDSERKPINIENNVFIGPNVTFTNDKYPISKQKPSTYANTILMKGCSIGANATILPGVTIGENSIVSVGSVVVKDVPDNCIVAGNPARVIKKIDK